MLRKFLEIRKRLASLEELIRSSHRSGHQAGHDGMDMASAGFHEPENTARRHTQEPPVPPMPQSLPLYMEDTPETAGGGDDDSSESPQIVGGMAMTVQERNVSAFFGEWSSTGGVS